MQPDPNVFPTPPNNPYPHSPVYPYIRDIENYDLTKIRSLPKASFGKRTVAWLVDFLSVGGLCGLIMFGLRYNYYVTLSQNPSYINTLYSVCLGGVTIALTGLSLLLAIAGYLTIGLGDGRTLGHRLAGIRFVDNQGQNLTFGANLTRIAIPAVTMVWLLFNTYALLLMLVTNSHYNSSFYLVTYDVPLSFLDIFGLAFPFVIECGWVALAYFWIVLDKVDHQSLYDKAAGVYAILADK
jgi:uncharacterized RDD family membrane protein YckC